MSTIATSPRESAPPPERATHERPPPAGDAGGRVARNLGALLGGQAITWSVTLAWTVVVPRALGPVGLGILVSAQSVSGVLGIVLGMGTRNYLVREAVINPADGPKLVGTALILRVAIAPIVGVAAIVWARLAGDGHQAATVLYLITAMTVLTLITEPLQAAFQAIERMKYLAYADVINKTAQSLIGIVLVLVGFKVVGIAANMAVISVVVLVLTYWWLRPHFSVDLRTSLGRMGHMTRQSISYWAFGLFGMVYFWIDTIMLSLMTRPEVVGWYGITSQLFQTLMFLPVLVQTAWLPRLVTAFTSGRRQLIEAARSPVELILVISTPIAVAMALVADPLIHAVYGPSFARAVPVMVILAFCIPPIYLNIILASVLLAAKRQRVWTTVMAGAAVFNPLLNLILIPLTEHRYHNGAIGAAVSLVVTEVLMDVIGLWLVGRHVFARRGVGRWGAAVLASAGMVGAAYASRPLGAELSLVLGLITFVVLAPALGVVRRHELALARAEFDRLRRQRGAAAAPQPQPQPQPTDFTPGSLDEGAVVDRSLPADEVTVVLATARRLRLPELLDPAPSPERDLCVAMILGRVLGAGTGLGTLGALNQTALAGEPGVAGAGEDDLNAAVDWLLGRQPGIEQRLGGRHFARGAPGLYDAAWGDIEGGSRPHLIYGLLCDLDGRPVAIEPLTGRPREDGSLRSQVARRKRRFGLSGIVVVGDRRLFKKANAGQLSADGADWVTALRPSTIQKLVRARPRQPAIVDGQEIWEIAGLDGLGSERLIGCRDRHAAARRARRREELLTATETDLDAIAERVAAGTLRGADRIWRAVGPALNRHRMRKYFQVTVTGGCVDYLRDRDRLAAAAALDGVTVLRTSLDQRAASPARVVRIHRTLARAEMALGLLQDPDLERLRIDQPAEDRVRAIALICMLAYYVGWHLETQQLAAPAGVAGDHDRKGGGRC